MSLEVGLATWGDGEVWLDPRVWEQEHLIPHRASMQQIARLGASQAMPARPRDVDLVGLGCGDG